MADQQIDYDRIAAEVQGIDYDALAREVSIAPSHDTTHEARPIATGGGRGTGLDVRKSNAWAKANAPTIGAVLSTVAGPGGVIPATVLASGGGFLGARARGDDRATAATEGAVQGAIEGGGGLALKGGRMIAHGLMRGTVPKNIAKKFPDVDIAGALLDRKVVPGSARSAQRVGRLSDAATVERRAAAATVPTMSRSKVIEGLRPIYHKGVTGKVPDMADAALDQMRASAREIGPSGLSGTQALARKDIKQALGNAALNAADPRTAAFGSQLANAERGAIVSHLRDTPRMASALDESQTLLAIQRVMEDAAQSNPVTRARVGGLTAAAMSPLGMGATAHAVNQGRYIADPSVVRALLLLLNQRPDAP